MTTFYYPFLDFQQFNESTQLLDSSKKLNALYETMNGQYWSMDEVRLNHSVKDMHNIKDTNNIASCKIMKSSKAAIVALGSYPVEIKEHDGHSHLSFMGQITTIEAIKEKLYQTCGMSAFMSYLNPKGKTLQELAQHTFEQKHYSILHMLSLSIIVCGITTGVEHEFSSQRDLVHLSRLTVAKTQAQNNPSLVLHDETHVQLYQHVMQHTQAALSDIHFPISLETRNLLFPAAKASAIILTGSLKNMLKLVALKDSGGKEQEFILALMEIDNILKTVFNDII